MTTAFIFPLVMVRTGAKTLLLHFAPARLWQSKMGEAIDLTHRRCSELNVCSDYVGPLQQPPSS